jgi:hypothetical protein
MVINSVDEILHSIILLSKNHRNVYVYEENSCWLFHNVSVLKTFLLVNIQVKEAICGVKAFVSFFNK